MNLPSSIIRSIARALRTDPEVQKMITRHPRFFRFIKNRLTPDEMFGLHLTIGISLTALFVSIAILLLRDRQPADPVFLLSILVALAIVYKHRANLARVCDGTESKQPLWKRSSEPPEGQGSSAMRRTAGSGHPLKGSTRGSKHSGG